MVKKVKKRRIKKKVKIFLLLLLFLIIVSIISVITIKTKEKKEKEIMRTKEEIIDSILSYELAGNIDNNFLNWINEEYGIKTLENLETILIEEKYTSNIWHELTSNSLIVLKDKYNGVANDRIKEITPKLESKEVTLSFIGDVSLADDWYIMPKYDERGKKVYGILSEEIGKNILKKFIKRIASL